ncbi:MAG: phasin family protein [Magnetococcus sp. MYC-9]
MLNSIAVFQKITARTMEDLAKQQAHAAESFVGVSSQQIKGMGNSASFQDVATAQSKMATELGKVVADSARQTMELLSRGQEELKELVEQNLSDMVAQAKSSA